MTDQACFCNSQTPFSICCAPFLKGERLAPSAEKLMRSRYSAYVTINTEYLLKTAHSSIRKNDSPKNIEHWAKSNQWQKLEVLYTDKGQESDKEGIVEFKAYYINENGKAEIHHEQSYFIKENGEWFYKSGIFNPTRKAKL